MSNIRVVRLQQDPTVTAGIYSANDAVGGLLTFAGIAPNFGGGSCILESVVILDEAKQSIAIDLVLFSETFTAAADNAIFSPSDADLLNCLGVISLAAGDYAAFEDTSLATVRNLGLPIKLTGASGSLFGQLVTRGTPTYAATTDIEVAVGLILGS